MKRCGTYLWQICSLTAGELRRLINVFVDGADVRGGRGLDEPLQADSEVRIVGAIAGG